MSGRKESAKPVQGSYKGPRAGVVVELWRDMALGAVQEELLLPDQLLWCSQASFVDDSALCPFECFRGILTPYFLCLEVQAADLVQMTLEVLAGA